MRPQQSPVIEDIPGDERHKKVTFYYEDPNSSLEDLPIFLALDANMAKAGKIGITEKDRLKRIPETNIYSLSIDLPNDLLSTYSFRITPDGPNLLDERNTRLFSHPDPRFRNCFSILRMPNAPENKYLLGSPADKGSRKSLYPALSDVRIDVKYCQNQQERDDSIKQWQKENEHTDNILLMNETGEWGIIHKLSAQPIHDSRILKILDEVKENTQSSVECAAQLQQNESLKKQFCEMLDLVTYVYLPKDHSDNGQPYPLILQLDGHAYQHLITNEMLDNMIAQGKIPPSVVVFLPPHPRGDRVVQYACNDDFNKFLVDELIPDLRVRFNCSAEAKDTFIAGSSLGGLASFYAGLIHPEVFGNVISQSGALWHSREEIDQAIDKFMLAEGKTHFIMDAGEFESGLFEPGKLSLLNANDEMAEKMQNYRHYKYTTFPGGHDYLCWQTTWPERLISAFELSAKLEANAVISALKANAKTFQDFLKDYSTHFSSLRDDNQRTQLSNAFWEFIKNITMPVIECADDGSYQVHFLYRKTHDKLGSNDLYVQGDYHGYGSTLEPQRLERVGNTDVMCVTTKIAPELKDALITYHFVEAPHSYQNKSVEEIKSIPNGDRIADLNDKNNYLPDPHSKHCKAFEGTEGQFCLNMQNDITPWRGSDNLTWPTFSEVLADERLIHFKQTSDGVLTKGVIDFENDFRSVQILKPTGLVEKVVIVNDGLAYLLCDGVNRLQEIAEQEKCAFIFISPCLGRGDEEKHPLGVRGIEYHQDVKKYSEFILNQLLPELNRQEVIPDAHPTNMTVIGASISGTAALQMGLTHPDRFSQVISHSPSPSGREMIDLIPNVNVVAKRVQIDLECGRFENPDNAQNDNLPYALELEGSLNAELHVGLHGHQSEAWTHDLTRSLPAMLSPQSNPMARQDAASVGVLARGGGFVSQSVQKTESSTASIDANNLNPKLGK